MARTSTRKDLSDQEIVRFLRFSVVESAAATFTEQSFDTQLSIDRGLIWLIHWIEFELNTAMIDDPAQAAAEYVSMQIARESQSAMIDLEDPDLVFKNSFRLHRMSTIGTDAGPVVIPDRFPSLYKFPIPLPYAATEIHVGIVSTASAAKTCHGRLAYTLRRVSDKFFYRVAQALIS